MNTPRGFNPVGESAPGLPRHDAPLPGHVPGQATPTPTQPENWSPSAGYRDPGFSPAFGKWSGRVIMVCAIYLTLPLQVALYPIAGAAGVLAGFVVYIGLSGSGMGRDEILSWCWSVCFLALLPAMRVETGLEGRVPAYRKLRHWLRLALIAGGFYYFQVHDQGEPPQSSALIAVIVAALAHFFLRAKLTRGLWNAFQTWLWLRKA
jgi:hypothetical protein